MGYTPGDMVERGARYLLDVLNQCGEVDYSRFYDGTDETHRELNRALGLDDDWYCAEHIIDLAAFQLEEQEVVTISELETYLADGEPDYRISLLPRGRRYAASKQLRDRLTFHDAE